MEQSDKIWKRSILTSVEKCQFNDIDGKLAEVQSVFLHFSLRHVESK